MSVSALRHQCRQKSSFKRRGIAEETGVVGARLGALLGNLATGRVVCNHQERKREQIQTFLLASLVICSNVLGGATRAGRAKSSKSIGAETPN
jgi:hypothetical protein